MVEDLSDAIALLGSGTYVVTRPGPSTLTSGRKVAVAATTFSIDASVQPAPGRTLENLPEGFRDRGGYVLFTTTLLRTSDGAAQEPDSVQLADGPHQVAAVEPWAALGNYYRVVVVGGRS